MTDTKPRKSTPRKAAKAPTSTRPRKAATAAPSATDKPEQPDPAPQARPLDPAAVQAPYAPIIGGGAQPPAQPAAADVDEAGETSPVLPMVVDETRAEGVLANLAEFLRVNYGHELRSDENPAETAMRLLDRSRTVPAQGIDPASGLPFSPAVNSPTAGGPATRSYTLTAEDLADADGFAGIANELGQDPEQLLRANAAVLDQEAIARGLANSDGGRHLFVGTVISLPA